MAHKIVKSRGVMQKTEEVSISEYVEEKLHSFNVQEQRLAKLVKEIANWVEDSESEELQAYYEEYEHLPAKFEVEEEDDSEDADESTEELSSEESEESLSEEDETEDA
tara:strand:+ start:179 stop:502 length:324 start_codon:yes stop_codon:yes gene_type:complete